VLFRQRARSRYRSQSDCARVFTWARAPRYAATSWSSPSKPIAPFRGLLAHNIRAVGQPSTDTAETSALDRRSDSPLGHETTLARQGGSLVLRPVKRVRLLPSVISSGTRRDGWKAASDSKHKRRGGLASPLDGRKALFLGSGTKLAPRQSGLDRQDVLVDPRRPAFLSRDTKPDPRDAGHLSRARKVDPRQADFLPSRTNPDLRRPAFISSRTNLDPRRAAFLPNQTKSNHCAS
jgi:hypothetical protein